MIYPFFDENGIEHYPSLLEVLGYAINNITEVEESAESLPAEFALRLRQARNLLREVEDYMFYVF